MIDHISNAPHSPRLPLNGIPSDAEEYPLPALPYLRLQMTLQAEEPAMMPAYQGSMLRGAFGHALRRTVCVMGPRQACADCVLRQACVYTRIFEPFVEGEPPPFLRGIDQAVRPYVYAPLGRGGGRDAALRSPAFRTGGGPPGLCHPGRRAHGQHGARLRTRPIPIGPRRGGGARRRHAT